MDKNAFEGYELVTVGLLLVLAAGCSRSVGESRTPDAPSMFGEQLSSIEAKLIALSGVSEDSDNRLKAIEQRISDKTNWPKDLDAAVSLRTKVQQVINGMSPLAQDFATARLLPLRWAVRAIWILRKADVGAEDQSDVIADELQAVLEAEPEAGVSALREELEQALHRADKLARQRALQTGKDAMAGKGNAASALEELQRFTNDDDQEVAAACAELRRTSAEREITAHCQELKTRLGRIAAVNDEVTRQAGLSRLYESAVGYRIDLLMTQPDLPADQKELNGVIAELGEKLRTLVKSQQDRQDALLRQYQRWALVQIGDFDRWSYDRVLEDVKSTYAQMRAAEKPLRWQLLEVFPTVRELLAEKIDAQLPAGEISAELQRQIYDKVAHLTHWSYASELAYRATRDAVVKYLAPIDERLLDRPVQQLFNKSYAQGWAKLEGRDDQLFIAQQAAVVVKRGLADMK